MDFLLLLRREFTDLSWILHTQVFVLERRDKHFQRQKR